MRRSLFAVLLLVALAGTAGADEASKVPRPVPTPAAAEAPLSPSPQASHITSQVYIGERAPDFELDGSSGQPVKLAHLKGYWLLLVFADRRADLGPLRAIEADLRRLGVRAYGICADKAHVLGSFAKQTQMATELLSDVTGEVSQTYGLYDTRMRLVRPGFVLIDRQCVVRMALLGQQIPFEEMLGLVKSSVTGS